MNVRKTIKFLGLITIVAAMEVAATSVTIDDGTTLPGANISSITIDPASGSIEITTVSGDWNITQDEPSNTDPVPSVNLLVNGGTSITVEVDNVVNVSWAVSDAATCTAVQGNSQWRQTNIALNNGSSSNDRDITVDFATSLTFTLRCSNGANTRQDSVTITGTPSGGNGVECPNVGTVDVIDWEDLEFDTSSTQFTWPDPRGNAAVVTNAGSRPVAIRFNTITAGFLNTNYGNFSNAPIPGNEGTREMAISECPGVFDYALTPRCGKRFGSGSIYWEIDRERGFLHTCKLEQGANGKDYYLNVRFPEGCGENSCSSFVGPYWY